MAKLEVVEGGQWLFYCEGCGSHHIITNDNRWKFNGNLDKPTFKPSYLIYEYHQEGANLPRCHSYITDGKIQYLKDSEHSLAGKTVEMTDVPLK